MSSATEKADNILKGAFDYLNKFRNDGVESYLPENNVIVKIKDKDPIEMSQLRAGFYEIGRKSKIRDEKKTSEFVPDEISKKKNVDVLGNYAKYVNFIKLNDDEADEDTDLSKSDKKNEKNAEKNEKNAEKNVKDVEKKKKKKDLGWRGLNLDEKKEKLDDFFIVTIGGVAVETGLKEKIYKLVEDGKMTTAKDVKFDKINRRIISIPQMMIYHKDMNCFIQPKIDKAVKKKRDAIKKAKAFFN